MPLLSDKKDQHNLILLDAAIKLLISFLHVLFFLFLFVCLFVCSDYSSLSTEHICISSFQVTSTIFPQLSAGKKCFKMKVLHIKVWQPIDCRGMPFPELLQNPFSLDLEP